MGIPKVRHIGRNVQKVRELKDMKQETLAGLLSVSQQAISKLEKSAKIDEDTLRRIADALEVSVDGLKNFNEDAIIQNINNNFHDNSTQNQFNSGEHMIDIYERMVKELKSTITIQQEFIENLKHQLSNA